MTMTYSDFRSDTVTRPTEKMRKAMAEAVVGDDVLGDDPTVQELERLAAETMGKEAALFCPSGTMANSIAVKMWTGPLEEVIVEERSHIYNMESTHMTFISGVTPRPVRSDRGAMDPKDVVAAVRKPNVHTPRTSLICLENTHNNLGGAVIPLDNFKAIRAVADEHGLKVHLDGARIFNASVASGVPVQEYAKQVDSVQFCLSKGLSAPVGSMLVAGRERIEFGRRLRKVLGGGMRQVGVLAAPGIIALTEMVDRLKDDHVRAKALARGISRSARDQDRSLDGRDRYRHLRLRPPDDHRARAAREDEGDGASWPWPSSAASAWSRTRTSATRTSTGRSGPSATSWPRRHAPAGRPRDRSQVHPQPLEDPRLLRQSLHRLRGRLRLLLRGAVHAAVQRPQRAVGRVRRRQGQRARPAGQADRQGQARDDLVRLGLRSLPAARGALRADPPLARGPRRARSSRSRSRRSRPGSGATSTSSGGSPRSRSASPSPPTTRRSPGCSSRRPRRSGRGSRC